LKIFDSRVVMRMFGPQREEWQEGRENCIMRSFMISALHQISFLLARICVGRRPLGRPRHRWEDNVKIDFKYLV
jgi:hypothetical protein